MIGASPEAGAVDLPRSPMTTRASTQLAAAVALGPAPESVAGRAGQAEILKLAC